MAFQRRKNYHGVKPYGNPFKGGPGQPVPGVTQGSGSVKGQGMTAGSKEYKTAKHRGANLSEKDLLAKIATLTSKRRGTPPLTPGGPEPIGNRTKPNTSEALRRRLMGLRSALATQVTEQGPGKDRRALLHKRYGKDFGKYFFQKGGRKTPPNGDPHGPPIVRPPIGPPSLGTFGKGAKPNIPQPTSKYPGGKIGPPLQSGPPPIPTGVGQIPVSPKPVGGLPQPGSKYPGGRLPPPGKFRRRNKPPRP